MLNEQLSPELQKQIEQEAKSSAADFNYFPGSEECEDLEAVYTTGAGTYASKWQEEKELRERYEKALKEIVRSLSGINDTITNDIVRIATEALTPKTGSDERRL